MKTAPLFVFAGALLLAGHPGAAQEPSAGATGGRADTTSLRASAGPVAFGHQEAADTADRRALAASPLLPPDHWAVRAAWRAEAMGLVPLFMPAQRAAPRLLVARALEQAAANAAGMDARTRRMVEGWLARFREEFPEADPSRRSDGSAIQILGGSAGGDWRRSTGRALPGSGIFQVRTTVTTLPDVSEAEARGVGAAAIGRHLAVLAEPAVGDGGARLPRWDARATLGAFSLSVGREHLGWGTGVGGSVVLTDAVLPRVELATAEPIAPWRPLRFLGPLTLHTFATRLGEPRQQGRPYFWGMRAGLRPHPRFAIGLNRAAIFGGDSIATPTTARTVAKMLLGIQTRDFENQEVSADFRFRPPTERVLPLELYLEWGAEDEAGGWWRAPGRVVGAYAPSLPFLPQVGVGVEHTDFEFSRVTNPPWYLHSVFLGGWVYPDRPLGHPLGGEGHEWVGYARADLLDARLRVDARGWRKFRGDTGYKIMHAGNLYAPERAGVSNGGSVDASFRALPRGELRLSASRDAGDGWREQHLRVGAAVLF